ncbi:hypothetical protein DFP72DRAFT_855785 [Ephemerocybe angulata]|uniref:F-box domain-containing protein n=1 Tax=Ephemerocybe angulata TaxID=980116 RepID=A0A8H6HF89_9AGAR|nr:hypothetical protein DFP72DRAFT_855785 [Tulosesus angulatus]
MRLRSDVSHLLNTNTVPTSIEIATVQNALDSLDGRISTLQSQLCRLEKQRRQHRAILSPVRRIPLEILAEDIRLSTSALSAGAGALQRSLLTRLWNGFSFTPSYPPNIYHRIVSWFRRSGSIPKSLKYGANFSYCQCTEGVGKECFTLHPALTKLLVEGPPLDHFTLVVNSPKYFREWTAAMDAATSPHTTPRPWDSLRSFKLKFHEDYENEREWDNSSDPAESIFLNLPPTMTSFGLYLPAAGRTVFPDGGDERTAGLNIPANVLESLTEFTIRCDWAGARLFGVLHFCTNLETLTIDFHHKSPLELEDDHPILRMLSHRPISLPSLRALRIRNTATIDVLRYMKAPALTHLDFSMWSGEDPDFADKLISFLDISNARSTLQSLRIYDLTIPAAELRRSLSNLPSLKRLTLELTKFADAPLFVDAHGDQDKITNVEPDLPSLEHFELLELAHDFPIREMLVHLKRRRLNERCTLTVAYMSKSWLRCTESSYWDGYAPPELSIRSLQVLESPSQAPDTKMPLNLMVRISDYTGEPVIKKFSGGPPRVTRGKYIIQAPTFPFLLPSSSATIMARLQNLAHLLNSNAVPNKLETATVQQEIDGLASKIAKAKSQHDRDVLEKQRKCYRAVLSPVRRMPCELLGEIFLLAVPLILHEDNRCAVLNLGRVCKMWREATLYARRLWSGLALEPYGQMSYEEVVSWLNRAGNLPKSLEFDPNCDYCDCYKGAYCNSTSPLLAKLLIEGPKIDHLTLSVLNTGCFQNWLRRFKLAGKESTSRPWDTLRSLSLTVHQMVNSEWEDGPVAPSRSIFKSLPPVICLHLYLPEVEPYYGDSTPGISIPKVFLKRLTEFTIECTWPGNHLIELLKGCVNVETLTIVFDGTTPFEDGDAELAALLKDPIRLPKVHTLRIQSVGPGAEILRYLKTTSLTTLELGFASWTKDDDNNFPERTRLRTSLSGLTSLKQLKLDKVTLSDNLFVAGTPAQKIPVQPHLPSIEHLELLELPPDGAKTVGFSVLKDRTGCAPCMVTLSCQKGFTYKEAEFGVYELKKAGTSLRIIPPFQH